MAEVSKMDFDSGGKVAENEEAPPAADSSGGGKKKLIIIIAGAVLLLVVILGVVFFLLMGGDTPEEGEEGKPNTEEEKPVSTFQEDEKKLLEKPIFTAPFEFQVNLKDGKRFLMVTMIFGLINEEARKFVEDRNPLVRDMILTTLQNKTTSELRNPLGVTQLKNTLVRKLNSFFTEEIVVKIEDKTPVKRVMFEKFLLQ